MALELPIDLMFDFFALSKRFFDALVIWLRMETVLDEALIVTFLTNHSFTIIVLELFEIAPVSI